MVKNINFLILALVAQLIFTTYIVIERNSSKINSPEKAQLLNFTLSKVDKIEITSAGESDADSESVLTLRYDNEKWTLPGYYSFEAQQEKVNAFIDKLLKLKRGWIVADSKFAVNRFKVDSDRFERKITFFNDGRTVGSLLIGTSTQFKKSHVRLASESEIYEVNLGTHEVSAEQRDWINTAYLHQEQDDVVNIELYDLKLRRDKEQNNQFVFNSDFLTKKDINQEKLETLLYRLTHMNLQEIIPTSENEAINAAAEHRLSYSLELKSGQNLQHNFYAIKDNSYYVLERTGEHMLFKVDKDFVDEIVKITPELLL